jgi:predicted DNA-binding ribbon-helix-helix protein
VRIIFRLTPEANDFLRGTNLAKRGLLTARLAEAIESVDLRQVEVVNLRTHWLRTTLDQTAVSIEDRHKELLRSEAKKRDCSVNALVNAILNRYRDERGVKGWKDDWGRNNNHLSLCD